jgi:tRNA (cmo5U34)-methyltransferase
MLQSSHEGRAEVMHPSTVIAMQPQQPHAAFNEQHASGYDQQWAKLAPLRDALHLLMGAALSELRPDARVLCVGAGTGAEMLYLAERFPGWRFTAVEPSGAMLEVCRGKASEAGIAGRCEFHEGFLETLSPSEPFDAATSLLVSQFILDSDAREGFFRAIAGRLRPGGHLVSTDLASDIASEPYEHLLAIWLRMMAATGVPPENLERLREVYGRDVAVLRGGRVQHAGAVLPGGAYSRLALAATYRQTSPSMRLNHKVVYGASHHR